MSTQESILYIAKQVVNDIDVEFVHGSPTGTSCKLKNGVPIITWDLDFWRYIEQNLFILDTLPFEFESDQKIITEYYYNFHGILYHHLSKRFISDYALSAAFTKLANDYYFPYFRAIYSHSFEVSEWETYYQLTVYACKLLAMYHELAHIMFSRDKHFKHELENMVINNVKGTITLVGGTLNETFTEFTPNRLSVQWLHEIIDKVISGDADYLDLLEEMAADLYAVSKTHATMFLNNKQADLATVSSVVLSGISTYYTHIAQYTLICAFWDNIRPDFWLSRTNNSGAAMKSLEAYDARLVIRSQAYPITLFLVVHQLDAHIWKETQSAFLTRLNQVLATGVMNDKWFRGAFESAMNIENYNKILKLAVQIKQNNESKEYRLNDVPDNSLIINWLSLQYHNNKGLLLQENNKLDEALHEFSESLYIAERYLGHNHRFTARECNNIVNTLLEYFKQSMSYKRLEEAKSYSDIAMKIIQAIDGFDDYQAASILQNAGVVAQWSGNPVEAIKQYKRAKKLKYKLYGKYNRSIAVTDSSIAAAYYDSNEIKLAQKHCTYVLNFFEKDAMGYKDSCYQDAKMLMSLLEQSV